MYMYINIYVLYFFVIKYVFIYLLEEGKLVICVKIYIVFGFLMFFMFIIIMYVYIIFVVIMIK